MILHMFKKLKFFLIFKIILLTNITCAVDNKINNKHRNNDYSNDIGMYTYDPYDQEFDNGEFKLPEYIREFKQCRYNDVENDKIQKFFEAIDYVFETSIAKYTPELKPLKMEYVNLYAKFMNKDDFLTFTKFLKIQSTCENVLPKIDRHEENLHLKYCNILEKLKISINTPIPNILDRNWHYKDEFRPIILNLMNHEYNEILPILNFLHIDLLEQYVDYIRNKYKKKFNNDIYIFEDKHFDDVEFKNDVHQILNYSFHSTYFFNRTLINKLNSLFISSGCINSINQIYVKLINLILYKYRVNTICQLVNLLKLIKNNSRKDIDLNLLKKLKHTLINDSADDDDVIKLILNNENKIKSKFYNILYDYLDSKNYYNNINDLHDQIEKYINNQPNELEKILKVKSKQPENKSNLTYFKNSYFKNFEMLSINSWNGDDIIVNSIPNQNNSNELDSLKNDEFLNNFKEAAYKKFKYLLFPNIFESKQIETNINNFIKNFNSLSITVTNLEKMSNSDINTYYASKNKLCVNDNFKEEIYIKYLILEIYNSIKEIFENLHNVLTYI